MSFGSPKFTSTPGNAPDSFLRTVNDVTDVIDNCIGTGNSILKTCRESKSKVLKDSPLLQQIVNRIDEDTKSITDLKNKLTNLGKALVNGDRDEMKKHFESTIENIQKISDEKLKKLADIDCAAKAQNVRKNFEKTDKELQSMSAELDGKATSLATFLIEQNQKVVNCLKYAEKMLIDLFEGYGKNRNLQIPEAHPRISIIGGPKMIKKILIFGESLVKRLPTPKSSKHSGNITIEESGFNVQCPVSPQPACPSTDFRKILRGYLEDSEGGLEEIALEFTGLFCHSTNSTNPFESFQHELTGHIEIDGQIFDDSVPVVEIDMLLKSETTAEKVIATVENEVTGRIEEVEVQLVPTDHDESIHGKILALRNAPRMPIRTIHNSFLTAKTIYDPNMTGNYTVTRNQVHCPMPAARNQDTEHFQTFNQTSKRNETSRLIETQAQPSQHVQFQTPTLNKRSHRQNFKKLMNYFRAAEAFKAGSGEAALKTLLLQSIRGAETPGSSFAEEMREGSSGESLAGEAVGIHKAHGNFQKLAYGVLASKALKKEYAMAQAPAREHTFNAADNSHRDFTTPVRSEHIHPKRFKALLDVFRAVEAFKLGGEQTKVPLNAHPTEAINSSTLKKNDLRSRLGKKVKTGSRGNLTVTHGKPERPARKRFNSMGDESRSTKPFQKPKSQKADAIFPRHFYEDVENIEDFYLSLVDTSSEEAVHEDFPVDTRATQTHQGRNYNRAPVLVNFTPPLNRNLAGIVEKQNENFRMQLIRTLPHGTLNKSEPFNQETSEFPDYVNVPAIHVNSGSASSVTSLDSKVYDASPPQASPATSMSLDVFDENIPKTRRMLAKTWQPANATMLHPTWDRNLTEPINRGRAQQQLSTSGFNQSFPSQAAMSDESFNNRALFSELHKTLNALLENIENPLETYSPERHTADFAGLQEQRHQDMSEERFQQLQNIGSPGFDISLGGDADWSVEDSDFEEEYDNYID